MSDGIGLLAVYSLGLGLPLFITALGVNAFLTSFKKLRNYLWLISVVSGVFLIIVGVLVFTNSLRLLAAWLTRYGIGWSVGQ
jgi:cytochrome c-type biogenesis protein